MCSTDVKRKIVGEELTLGMHYKLDLLNGIDSHLNASRLSNPDDQRIVQGLEPPLKGFFTADI